jgi:hypothetical protein
MAKALQIAHDDAHELFVPRIRRLLEERADIRGARRLLAEAREHGSLEPELEEFEKLLAPPTYKLTPAEGLDRSSELQWLREHAKEYRGQWVAVLQDRLLAHSPILREVTRHLEEVAPGAPALLHFIEN